MECIIHRIFIVIEGKREITEINLAFVEGE